MALFGFRDWIKRKWGYAVKKDDYERTANQTQNQMNTEWQDNKSDRDNLNTFVSNKSLGIGAHAMAMMAAETGNWAKIYKSAETHIHNYHPDDHLTWSHDRQKRLEYMKFLKKKAAERLPVIAVNGCVSSHEKVNEAWQNYLQAKKFEGRKEPLNRLINNSARSCNYANDFYKMCMNSFTLYDQMSASKNRTGAYEDWKSRNDDTDLQNAAKKMGISPDAVVNGHNAALGVYKAARNVSYWYHEVYSNWVTSQKLSLAEDEKELQGLNGNGDTQEALSMLKVEKNFDSGADPIFQNMFNDQAKRVNNYNNANLKLRKKMNKFQSKQWQKKQLKTK